MSKNKSKKFNIFTLLYIVGFVGAGLIGFLSKSYFAYDIFNSLWANVLYLVLISMLFITAFCQEIIASRAVADIIINVAIFIVGLIFLILYFVWLDFFALCMLLLSATMAIVLCCRYALALRKNPQKKITADIKQIIGVGSLFLFAMMQHMSISYVNEMFMAWALIPASVALVIGAIVVTVLLKSVWAEIFPTKIKRILGAIGVGFVIFFVAFCYSFITVSAVNCIFDGEPQQIEYTVLEKKVRSGASTATQFEVKVIIDEKEKWLPVPVTDYHEIAEGDQIIVNYYSGALNFAYYLYYGIA